MTLDNERQTIDRLDEDIARLLNERMACSERIASIKRASGLDVYDARREDAVLAHVRKAGGRHGEEIARIYRAVMEESKALQTGKDNET